MRKLKASELKQVSGNGFMFGAMFGGAFTGVMSMTGAFAVACCLNAFALASVPANKRNEIANSCVLLSGTFVVASMFVGAILGGVAEHIMQGEVE